MADLILNYLHLSANERASELSNPGNQSGEALHRDSLQRRGLKGNV